MADQATKDPRTQREVKRELIIEALAAICCEDVARKSIELEMGKPSSKEWARLRNAIGVQGYATTDEVITQLKEIL